MRTRQAIEVSAPRQETREPTPSSVAQNVAPPARPQLDNRESIESHRDTPSVDVVEAFEITRQVTLERESANANPFPNTEAALAATAPETTHGHAPAQPAKGDAPSGQTERPSITISIGRIAIDFGREAPAAAAAPAREVQRTRGFDNYAGARRGRPR